MTTTKTAIELALETLQKYIYEDEPSRVEHVQAALEQVKSTLAVARTADGARRLHVDFSVPNPEPQEEQARALLEIGFDLGVAAALAEVLKAEGRTLPSDHVENPFRSASTVIGCAHHWRKVGQPCDMCGKIKAK